MAPTYTTTAHGLRWLPGSNLASDIDAGFQTLAEDVDAMLMTSLTSLPGSPVDGQQIYYVADATNGIVWHLRYRSASASSYKWEFVGGSELAAEVTTQESSSSTTYVDLTTVGPTVTAPLAGDYRITIAARVASTENQAWLAAKLGAAAAADAEATKNGSVTTVIQHSGSPMRSFTRTIAAAATAVKLQYRAETSGSSPLWANRSISIRPIRVG